MNLLLLRDGDLSPDGTALLTGRRLTHARSVLRAAQGSVLRVGKVGGLVGEGRVIAATDTELRLAVTLTGDPPPRPGIDVLLAMPRPKALKRILASVASLGVDRLVLMNAARVEKSYFDAHALAPESIAEHLALGLEQARDTRPPEVLVRERFRPFVEDELDRVVGAADRLLLHPGAAVPLSAKAASRTVIAVGPEGGFVPFEVELLSARGFVPRTLGPRTLRVEVAIAYALGRLTAT